MPYFYPGEFGPSLAAGFAGDFIAGFIYDKMVPSKIGTQTALPDGQVVTYPPPADFQRGLITFAGFIAGGALVHAYFKIGKPNPNTTAGVRGLRGSSRKPSRSRR